MAKTVQSKKVIQEKQKPPIIPEKYQDLFYIVLLILLIFGFFSPAILGGGFNAMDNAASESFKTYLEQANKDGKFPLWIPYIFSGMPSYASLLTTGARSWDIISMIFIGATKFVGTLFSSDVARVSCFYVMYALGMFWLMRFKKHQRFVAFFTAFAAVFSTYVITWIMIGHNTKPIVFAMFPFIILFLEKLKERFSLVYAVLLVFAVHIMMLGSHLQMIFYGFCAFGLYILFELLHSLFTKKNVLGIIRSAVILAAAGGLAFVLSADRYLSTMEYTPYSTRGSAPIIKTEKQHQDASGGNDYDYATMWSFSPQETMTFLVPNYYGFGRIEYKGELTQNQPVQVSTYWGQKESEDSPPYMGILVLGLGIIGFIMFRKDPFIQFLLVLSLFSLLLSFGKTLPVLYDLFFNLVPSFNKFRAPSMSLALMHFAFPILAGYGLTAILNWRKKLEESDKKILYGGIIAAGAFLVIGFLFSGAFKTSYMDSFTSSAVGQKFPAEIHDFIWSNMINDWYITALIALVMGILALFYVRKKIAGTVFLTAVTILLVFDMWRVDYRPMEVAEKPIQNEIFKRTDVIDFLKNDKSIFRIADFVSQPANVPAYFRLENVNGYHAAKMRIYQDLMDVANLDQAAGSTSVVYNPFLWNLMNVKYLIAEGKIYEGLEPVFQSRQSKSFVFQNPGFLPRTFFVNTTQVAKQMDILKNLKNGDYNPKEVAYIEKTLPIQIDVPDSSCYSKVLTHKNEYIKIEAKASGNNLLYISEIYYPVSWRAYVDNKEVPIYKTNFAFRSVVVPKGKHTIEMKFESKKFETGKTLSMITGIVLNLLVIVAVLIEIRRKKSSKELTIDN
ncbi:MAG: YfhO family protein [Ignavibacteriae bacterium]|nr:YfhO family protein [Ignavibacteriota bacterium]